MSDRIQIETNVAELLARYERLPENQKDGIARGLGRALILVEGAVRRNARLKLSGSRSGLGSRLTSHTARLAGLGIDGVIGFRKTRHFPYELAQEFGARAKPGRAMVVPVSARAKAGSARGEGPRQVFQENELFIPRGTHVLATKGRQRWANQHGRGNAEFTVHYVLIKGLRPRLNFRSTVLSSGPVISRETMKGFAEGVRRS